MSVQYRLNRDASAAKIFKRVTRVLDCIPEVWYDYVYRQGKVSLIWGYGEKSKLSFSCNEITQQRAKTLTEADLEELSMELTFGCGRV